MGSRKWQSTQPRELLTLTVLVTTIDALGHFETGYMTAQCEGMGPEHKGFKLQ